MRSQVTEEDLADLAGRDLPWDLLADSTILVTGAYGFIPAYITEALLYMNEQSPGLNVRVLALGRNPEKAEARFAHYRGRDDLVFLQQDVCEPLRDAPERLDYIIHGASWASPKYYGQYPVDVMAPNIRGTQELLALAREKGTRNLLFMSSAEIYGDPPPDQVPIPESFNGNVDPAAVRSCYAESKRVGETLCASWWHQHKVSAKIARIFHTYGPGMALDDGRVFADFVRDVVNGRDIHMRSEGTAIRAYCYLADAVDGLLRILLMGNPAEPYNMGNEDAACSVLELAETLVGSFPEQGLSVVREQEDRQGYLKSTIHRTLPDTAKLRSLGWRPRYGIKEGFMRTVRSYLESP